MTTSATSDSAEEPLRESRFRIHGSVQGVGFRWWTRYQALRLNLSGSVRNTANGTVEVRARGREVDVEALAELLKEGAPGARVTRVEVAPDDGVPRNSFEIAP